MAEKSVRMEWSSRDCECIFIEIKIIFKVEKKFLSLVGVRFAHEWSENEYRSFLLANGWPIEMCIVLKGRIDLAYVECMK